MSIDTSVECRSICRPRCRPIYRSMGAQNTHDPINNRFFIVSFFLQANMKKLNWMFMSVILTTLHFVVAWRVLPHTHLTRQLYMCDKQGNIQLISSWHQKGKQIEVIYIHINIGKIFTNFPCAFKLCLEDYSTLSSVSFGIYWVPELGNTADTPNPLCTHPGQRKFGSSLR